MQWLNPYPVIQGTYVTNLSETDLHLPEGRQAR